MAKTGHVQVRIDPDVKQSAEDIFNQLGFTSSDAVRMFFHQVVISKGLPFEVKIPNAETQQAIDDIENNVDLTTCKSIDEFKEFIDDL